MRFLKWCFGVSAGLIVILVVTYIAANAFDESLDPGAIALAKGDWPVSEQGTRAFYYLLGIRAGETHDPEGKGRELWASALALPAGQEGEFFRAHLQDRWTTVPFSQHAHEIQSIEWKTRPEVRAAFSKVQPELQQYIRLIEYGEISPLHTRDLWTSANASPQMLLKGARWLHVYLGKLVVEKKWKEAERLVRLEANFQKSFWKGPTLLSMMVGAVIMQADARFLDDEKKLNPKLPIAAETLEALKMPPTKELVHEALITEFRYFTAAVGMVMQQGMSETFGPDAFKLPARTPVRWVLLPNETINRDYQLLRDVDEKICEDMHCYASVRWSDPTHLWKWVRNPLGRELMWVLSVNVVGRFQALQIKHKDIDDIIARLSSQAP